MHSLSHSFGTVPLMADDRTKRTVHRRRPLFSRLTLGIVLVMYAIDVGLWVIDIKNVIVELNVTLLSQPSSGAVMSLDQRYATAGDQILKLVLVQDVLYSYMVSNIPLTFQH